MKKDKIVKKRKAESDLKISLIKKAKIQDQRSDSKISKQNNRVTGKKKTSEIGKTKGLKNKKQSIR